MQHDHDALSTALAKVAALAAAWLGSVTLAEVQQVVSILSGLGVLIASAITIRNSLRPQAKEPRQ